MVVTLYTIEKRINSTKTPTSAGKAFSGVLLKSPSSVVRPKISFKWDSAGLAAPTAYNYAYIGDYHRYYWIDEWTYDDRQWTASMSVDVLASWKDSIGYTTKYVLRANDTTGTTPVVDNKYPAESRVLDAVSAMTGTFSNWATVLEQGKVVVSIVGESNGYSSAGLSYFQMSTGAFNNLVKACFTQAVDLWSSGGSLGTDLGTVFQKFGENWVRTLNDPFQYIKGAMWYPCSFSVGSAQTIRLGALNTGVSAYPLTDTQAGFSATGVISGNTIIGQNVWDIYKCMSPYKTAKIRMLPFGLIPIDTAVTAQHDGTVCLHVTVDAVSGIGRADVYAGATHSINADYLLSTTSAQIGVPLAIANSSINYLTALKGAAGAVGSVAAAYNQPSAEGVLGAAASVGNALQSFSPQVSVSGSSGGIVGIDPYPVLLTETRYAVTDDPIEFGYPLCEMRMLNTISGFIQCADPEIGLAGAYPEEIRQVGDYLTGGFYYE